MSRILNRRQLTAKIFELTIETPRIARKAQPGQFVVVMADESGERIPLTIADFDRESGTVTLVVMVVGASTLKLSRLKVGDRLFAVIGPLGKASEIEKLDTVAMVAGGVGAAPIYPIARAFHASGSRVITIQGSRSEDLLFWTDRLSSVSDRHIITTDDGSAGRKGLVTGPLEELFSEDTSKRIGCVYAIGPAIMMKFCSIATRPFGVRTVVSLNPVMVDGTGMCGGCRVEVDGKTRFTCVDGPEFDGHLVDWDLLLSRQKIYTKQEECSLQRISQDE
ncbi:MAG: sulfide/dihydroorotate dehydrogenase-like FAD/NAD-binding protein [Thermoguttaceae bacterium]|jgi:ferredoxin--NADP+ reductase